MKGPHSVDHDEYDNEVLDQTTWELMEAGLLPEPQSNLRANVMESTPDIPPRLFAVLERSVHAAHDLHFAQLREYEKLLTWTEDQLRRASANANAHYFQNVKLRRLVAWLMDTYEWSEPEMRAFTYAVDATQGQ